MPKPLFADAGSRSSFFIIDEKSGFKTFTSFDDAEYAHYAQSKLSEHNLAPKVLSEVKKMIVGGYKEWGFVTEKAEVMGCGGNECACGECEDIWESKLRYINNLCNKIEELGFHFADNHIGNLGYVKRKGRRKLVCIDTGAESVSAEYDPYEDEECSCTGCRRLS